MCTVRISGDEEQRVPYYEYEIYAHPRSIRYGCEISKGAEGLTCAEDTDRTGCYGATVQPAASSKRPLPPRKYISRGKKRGKWDSQVVLDGGKLYGGSYSCDLKQLGAVNRWDEDSRGIRDANHGGTGDDGSGDKSGGAGDCLAACLFNGDGEGGSTDGTTNDVGGAVAAGEGGGGDIRGGLMPPAEGGDEGDGEAVCDERAGLARRVARAGRGGGEGVSRAGAGDARREGKRDRGGDPARGRAGRVQRPREQEERGSGDVAELAREARRDRTGRGEVRD